MDENKIKKTEIKSFWKEHKKAIFILLGTWGLYFFTLWPRIISIKPDGLYLGHVNVWSDWALHIGLASIFAYKNPQFWFSYHPMYAGGQLIYGFLTDFISGMLMRLGVSIPSAFIIPSIIFTILLLIGMYLFLYLVLKSKRGAFLAIFLFFLSSGLGFINFIKDFISNPNLNSFLYPAVEYSRLDAYQWGSGNVVVGMLVPQRAFLLGMTLAIWVLTALIYVFLKEQPGNKSDKIILVVSGIFAGLLPITHMHSFIVLVVLSGIFCLSLIKKWKLILYYAVPAALVSAIFYLKFIYGGIENLAQFFTWFPGWTIKGGVLNWINGWFYLWGAMIPLAVFGWFILRKKKPLSIQMLFLGFFLLFIFANLILIQPIPWDNSKIFLWVYFGFSVLAVYSFSWCWQRNAFWKILTIILFFTLTMTGFLELIRLQRIDRNRILETSTDDIGLGLQIRENTDPLAVFLTEPSHNHLIMVWGNRPILMGYTAWVWNYGFNYQQRERDIYTMFQGGQSAEELLGKYRVSYVAIGPGELYTMRANENYFSSNFPIAFQNKNYRIYDVRKLWLQ